MGAVVLGGVAVTLAGLAGSVWCIVETVRARRAGLDDAALRARMQRVVVINLAALMLSVLGLMVVILGLVLG